MYRKRYMDYKNHAVVHISIREIQNNHCMYIHNFMYFITFIFYADYYYYLLSLLSL